MDREKQQLSIEAARLYYQSDYSQQQIAEQLNISRPTVSRLLQYAKEKGYVQIRVMDLLRIWMRSVPYLKRNTVSSRRMLCFPRRPIMQELHMT